MKILNILILFLFIASSTFFGCIKHISITKTNEDGRNQLKRAIGGFKKKDYASSMDILLETIEEYPDTAKDPDILYLMAMNYHMLKDNDRAIRTWETFLSQTSILHDYGLYYLGLALAERGDYFLAKETLSGLINDYPQSRFVELCKIRLAEYLVMMGNVEEGLRMIQQLKTTIPSNLLPELLLSMGRIYEYLGDFTKAFEAYLELYVKFPLDDNAVMAKEKIDLMVKEFNMTLTTKNLMERISNLTNHAKFALALKELSEMDPEQLSREDRQRYLYLRALAEYNLRQYASASRTLEKSISSGVENADLLFLRGKVLSRLGNIEEARRTYNRIITGYPDSEWVDNAYYKLAALSYLENNLSDALGKIDFIINNFPQSDSITDALWAKVWYAFRSSRTEDAISALKLLSTRRDVDGLKNSAVRYWLARILESQDRTTAEAIYNEIILKTIPPDFYTLLAIVRMRSSNMNLQFEPINPAVDIPVYNGNLFHLRHAQKLFELGFDEDAEYESKLAEMETQSDPGKLFLVGEFYNNAEMYYDSILLARIYLPDYIYNPDNFSFTAAKLAFPRGYRQLVEEYSKKYHLDPNLIYAVILAESMFNKDSISTANAMGLMQIIPSTGKFVASIAGLRNFNTDMLLDPEINLGLGTKYLSMLAEQYNSNLILMLAHYNAGPTNLNSWIERSDPREVDTFVENIPFNETREYIKKVISYYCFYTWLYGGNINIPLILGVGDNNVQSTVTP